MKMKGVIVGLAKTKALASGSGRENEVGDAL